MPVTIGSFRASINAIDGLTDLQVDAIMHALENATTRMMFDSIIDVLHRDPLGAKTFILRARSGVIEWEWQRNADAVFVPLNVGHGGGAGGSTGGRPTAFAAGGSGGAGPTFGSGQGGGSHGY